MTLDFAREVARALRVSTESHLSRAELVGAVLALDKALDNVIEHSLELLRQAE